MNSLGVALSAALLNTYVASPVSPPGMEPAQALSGDTAQTLYLGDVDGDGLQDILAIDRTGQTRLLLNFGSGRYEDITLLSGLADVAGATCALFEDLDGDGHEDLFLGSSEARTWRNMGDGTFRPIESGIDHDLVDLAASSIDADQDGRLDLRILTERGDLIYLNEGNGRFRSIELLSLLDGPVSGTQSPVLPGVAAAQIGSTAAEASNAQPADAARRRLARWSQSRALGGGFSSTSTSVPNQTQKGTELFCAPLLRDVATDLCIEASSSPVTGTLLPLGENLDFDSNNAFFGLPGITGAMRISTPGGFPGIVAEPNDGTTAHAIQFFNDSVSINPDGGFPELIVQDSGRVGIGTQDPMRPLHVRSAGDGVVRIDRATDNPAVEFNRFPDFDFGSPPLQTWQVGADSTGFVISDRIALADRLTIDSSGLVSIKQSLEIRGGADIVEGFDSSCGKLDPGTVVVIDPDHPGALACATEIYDTKVAGVVSGAGGVNPGISLGQDGMLDGDTLVAMTGRVYVKASAENGAIAPGDRLTTASLMGHAMKSTDSARSDGAVIGKAMSRLTEGTGLVLVLVNLQ